MDLDKLKTTEGLDVEGKRVLLRADLNVPVRDGEVSDATRLERLLPGLTDLADRGAKVIVISHFGRPKGGPDAEFSLRPVADELSKLAGRPVVFGDTGTGRHLMVVYEEIDADTVYPVTAYEVPRKQRP